jgi:hypothetical protein
MQELKTRPNLVLWARSGPSMRRGHLFAPRRVSWTSHYHSSDFRAETTRNRTPASRHPAGNGSGGTACRESALPRAPARAQRRRHPTQASSVSGMSRCHRACPDIVWNSPPERHRHERRRKAGPRGLAPNGSLDCGSVNFADEFLPYSLPPCALAKTMPKKASSPL